MSVQFCTEYERFVHSVGRIALYLLLDIVLGDKGQSHKARNQNILMQYCKECLQSLHFAGRRCLYLFPYNDCSSTARNRRCPD